VNRAVWEGPHRVVEDGEVRSLRGHSAGLADGDVVGGNGLSPSQHLGTEGLTAVSYTLLDNGYERSEPLVHEIAAVAEAE
jgi:hypothetical protein